MYIQNSATEHVLNTYRERFPWHAHAADQKGPLRMYSAIDAMKMALVQHNAKHSAAWMVYDKDSITAATDWIDADAPIPNILAINPDNGHAHLFYGLTIPVHKYEGASEKAIRYFSAIDIALTEKLGADPNYNKFMSKNPLHDRWTVVVPREELYTLDQLARGLELGRLMDGRCKQPDIGYGRNYNLFHGLRRWAYSERRKSQQYLSFEMFKEATTWRGHAINAQFAQPLPASEVRATAKSISRWTWQNMSPQGFKEWADKRRERSIRSRQAKAKQLRQEIIQAIKECPQLSQGDIAAMMGVTRRTVINHLNEYKEGVKSVISDKEPLETPTNTIGELYE